MPDLCVSCLRGFYDECGHEPKVNRDIGSDTSDNSHTGSVTDELAPQAGTPPPPSDFTDDLGEPLEREHRKRRHKPDDAVRDQQSTGRKRAARLYPLHREELCEWAEATEDNPKGGGTSPVTQPCLKGQQARHHGPDKNTLNNEPGNVHRICHFHHNLWHRQNDPDYDPNKPLKD